MRRPRVRKADHGLIWRTTEDTYSDRSPASYLPEFSVRDSDWSRDFDRPLSRAARDARSCYRPLPTAVLLLVAFVLLSGGVEDAGSASRAIRAIVAARCVVGLLHLLPRTAASAISQSGRFRKARRSSSAGEHQSGCRPGRHRSGARDRRATRFTEIESTQRGRPRTSDEACMRTKVAPALLAISKCPDLRDGSRALLRVVQEHDRCRQESADRVVENVLSHGGHHADDSSDFRSDRTVRLHHRRLRCRRRAARRAPGRRRGSPGALVLEAGSGSHGGRQAGARGQPRAGASRGVDRASGSELANSSSSTTTIRRRHDPKTDVDPKSRCREGIFYPRSSGVGGCTVHNAMITIAGPDSDWDDLADFVDDDSWRGSAMRAYFQRLERNEYHRCRRRRQRRGWVAPGISLKWLFGRDADHTRWPARLRRLAAHEPHRRQARRSATSSSSRCSMRRSWSRRGVPASTARWTLVRGVLKGRIAQRPRSEPRTDPGREPRRRGRLVPLAVCGERRRRSTRTARRRSSCAGGARARASCCTRRDASIPTSS